MDALIEILNNPLNIKIDRIFGSLPDEAWVEKYEQTALNTIESLKKALKNYNYFELDIGQIISVDNVIFEIFGIKNPELINDADFSPVNNQSIVMLLKDNSKSVLFTGDLGGGGGGKILKGIYGNKLKADYVQMSHHGQHGVYESFYQSVKPKYCLWPTPCWLWKNDNGGGPNSGQWMTFEVRSWMEKLGVKKHFVSCEGLYCIE